MQRSRFDIDRMRLDAAHTLPAECFDDFQRLSRSLLYGPRFQWLLVDAPADALRADVRGALDRVLHAAGLKISEIVLGEAINDARALESKLIELAACHDIVHVSGHRGWFDGAQWDALNARRERIASHARARLVFWLDAHAIEAAANFAPDLWAWRAGVYEFAIDRAQKSLTDSQISFSPTKWGRSDSRSMAERHKRLIEIDQWIAEHPDAPKELKGAAFEERGQLLAGLGYDDLAIIHWREVAAPFYRSANDDHRVAEVFDQMADHLLQRGRSAEAMEIWRNEVLPLRIKTNDKYGQVETLGKIANSLWIGGDVDSALRISIEERLPLAKQLRDPLCQALAMGDLANYLAARGDTDEALRIRSEEVLPVVVRLGNNELRAMTLGSIADTLTRAGRLAEALDILRNQVLPLLDPRDEASLRSSVFGQIANILTMQGRLDEAKLILEQERLPLAEKLGDLDMRGTALVSLASILTLQNKSSEALKLLQDFVLPIYIELKDDNKQAILRFEIARLICQIDPTRMQEIATLLRLAHKGFKQTDTSRAEATLDVMQRLGIPCTEAGPAD
jgi:tetratricopeptide (TPR) repeat protein